MKANKKLIQQQLCQETGRVILLKDLSNIATAKAKDKSRNDLDVTVKYGEVDPSHKLGVDFMQLSWCFITHDQEIFSDEENDFKGIFFQDQQMKEAFHAYPELVCIDATYKLLEFGLPVYLMLCEYSNGQSEIVVLCLLVMEDVASMTWMVNAFKRQNAEWKKIRVLMADKDIEECDVLKLYLELGS